MSKPTPTPKMIEARATVPAHLLPHFDALVAQYKFRCTTRHSRIFVSPWLLRDLVVEDGVRCPWVEEAKAQP